MYYFFAKYYICAAIGSIRVKTAERVEIISKNLFTLLFYRNWSQENFEKNVEIIAGWT